MGDKTFELEVYIPFVGRFRCILRGEQKEQDDKKRIQYASRDLCRWTECRGRQATWMETQVSNT